MKSGTLIYSVALSLMILFSAGNKFTYELTGEYGQVKQINVLARQVESGDIVFRLGYGFISESLKKFSLKDPRYSHAGIISVENGKPFVYHLLGGESSISVMRRESFEDFCSSSRAACFAVYRASLNSAQKKYIDSLNRYYFRIRLPYDSQFDLATDSAMYCTEYVYKVLSRAEGNNILISSSMLSGRSYIACDDIYLNPALRKVFSFEYE